MIHAGRLHQRSSHPPTNTAPAADMERHHLGPSHVLLNSETEQQRRGKVGTKIHKCATFPPQSNNAAKAFMHSDRPGRYRYLRFLRAQDVDGILREALDSSFDVHPPHLPLPRPLARTTRLVWSHSQLNVPSANISTFLRLESIAIIFLRP